MDQTLVCGMYEAGFTSRNMGITRRMADFPAIADSRTEDGVGITGGSVGGNVESIMPPNV